MASFSSLNFLLPILLFGLIFLSHASSTDHDHDDNDSVDHALISSPSSLPSFTEPSLSEELIYDDVRKSGDDDDEDDDGNAEDVDGDGDDGYDDDDGSDYSYDGSVGGHEKDDGDDDEDEDEDDDDEDASTVPTAPTSEVTRHAPEGGDTITKTPLSGCSADLDASLAEAPPAPAKIMSRKIKS